jgi:uncharacterized membrane protein
MPPFGWRLQGMIVATLGDGFYNFVLVLHILCAIIGFGAVFLNGIYGQQMKVRMQSGRGAEALGIYEANVMVSKIGEYFIYAVFVLGLGLVGLAKTPGDHQFYKFDQTWIWLSIVLFVIALGLSHGVLWPTVKRMGVLMREMLAGPPPAGGPPPQAVEMEALGKKVGVVGPTLDLILIAILSLMVFKPGGP